MELNATIFVVQGNGPVLLRLPDIELLHIIRVMSEKTDNKKRKFDVINP